MHVVPPRVTIPRPHWKVGDWMNDQNGRFQISQMALIETSHKAYLLVFYDQQGRIRGDMELVLNEH